MLNKLIKISGIKPDISTFFAEFFKNTSRVFTIMRNRTGKRKSAGQEKLSWHKKEASPQFDNN